MKNKKSARNKLLTTTESVLPKFSPRGACSDATVDSGQYDINPYLKKGSTVLIPQKSDKIAGKLKKVSQGKLSLEFNQSPSPPFQVGKRAKIQYWDESYRSLWWKSEIISTSFHGRQMEVSILGKGVERRQDPRLHMAIPFFFSVTQANQTRLIGRQDTSETINVGLGGVFFKTDLELQVGNKLELDLRLSPSQHVYASGWVVRSDSVDRPTYVNGTMVVRSVYSIGVEFQQLEGTQRLRLREYLAGEEDDSHPSPENSLVRVVKGLKAGLQRLVQNPERSFIRTAKGLKAGLQKLSERIHQPGDR